MSSRRQRISNANYQKNPFEKISDKFERFEKKDVKIKIECMRNLNANLMEKCFETLVENMQESYKASPLGWDPNGKKKDLNANWARFLIVKDERNDEFIGFSMFRFDMNYGKAVLYW